MRVRQCELQIGDVFEKNSKEWKVIEKTMEILKIRAVDGSQTRYTFISARSKEWVGKIEK